MILETLSSGLDLADVGLTLNRVALGTFFAISGYHKLFNKDRHASIVKTMQEDRVPLVGVNQWFVPIVEFCGGIALALGVISILAALMLGAICCVATFVDGFKRVKSWNPIDLADEADDVLYLPEVLYGLMLLIVILVGPGAYRVDALFI